MPDESEIVQSGSGDPPHRFDPQGECSDLIAEAYERGVAEGRRQAAEEIAHEIEAKAERVRLGAQTPSAGIALAAVLNEGADIARRLGPCHEKGSTDG